MVDKTRKLYYSCPIKALYMMQEFGVKINQRDSDPGEPLTIIGISIKEMIDDILPYWNPRYEKENRLYVAPESEAILEPKLFDLGHHLDDAPVIYQKEVNSGEMAWLGSGHYYGLYKDWEVEIIKREGKLFFAPEADPAKDEDKTVGFSARLT